MQRIGELTARWHQSVNLPTTAALHLERLLFSHQFFTQCIFKLLLHDLIAGWKESWTVQTCWMFQLFRFILQNMESYNMHFQSCVGFKSMFTLVTYEWNWPCFNKLCFLSIIISIGFLKWFWWNSCIFQLFLQQLFSHLEVMIGLFWLALLPLISFRSEIHLLTAADDVDIRGFQCESERLAGLSQLLGELKQLTGQLIHHRHFVSWLEIILNHRDNVDSTSWYRTTHQTF